MLVVSMALLGYIVWLWYVACQVLSLHECGAGAVKLADHPAKFIFT